MEFEGTLLGTYLETGGVFGNLSIALTFAFSTSLIFSLIDRISPVQGGELKLADELEYSYWNILEHSGNLQIPYRYLTNT